MSAGKRQLLSMCSPISKLPTPPLQLRLNIDDPLDSTAVHLCSGLVGTLLNGMFANPAYVAQSEGGAAGTCGGFVYANASGGLQLGMQLLGVAVIAAWTAFFSLLIFMPLRHFGFLRVDQATELAGIDNIEHGGNAFALNELSPIGQELNSGRGTGRDIRSGTPY